VDLHPSLAHRSAIRLRQHLACHSKSYGAGGGGCDKGARSASNAQRAPTRGLAKALRSIYWGGGGGPALPPARSVRPACGVRQDNFFTPTPTVPDVIITPIF
jgi:hypothetical protein